MFLHTQHENHQHQLKRQKHLNEKPFPHQPTSQRKHIPWAIDTPGPNLVATLNSPGAKILINPAAVIPPNTCAKVKNTARSGGSIPVNASARETAGLKIAPDTRKNIHALITRDKPKATAMNIKFAVLTPGTNASVAVGRLAMCAAAKPMNKNIVVPMYSPI